jgi:hypothetical protein
MLTHAALFLKARARPWKGGIGSSTAGGAPGPWLQMMAGCNKISEQVSLRETLFLMGTLKTDKTEECWRICP